MNQQSHDQPGLAQPGPAQRDPGHQGSAPQAPAQNGGVEQGNSQRGEAQETRQGSHQVKPQGGEPAGNASFPSNAAAGGKRTGVKNEAVAGPFTVRDLTVFAATVVLFVASLIPMFALRYNLWNLGSLFFLGLGIVLPLIVAALFVARRLAPETKVRIGSLSIDQFGSVVASFAVAFFFLSIAGALTPSLLVALIGSLVLLAATVLAPFIPFFAGDFLDRAEAPAHVMARESAVPVQKPKAPKAPKAPKPAKPSDAKPVDAKPSVQDSPVQGSSVQGPTAGGQYAAGQTFGASPATGSSDTGTAAGVAAAPSPGAWSATNAAAASPETQAATVVPSAEASAAEASAAEASAAEASPAEASPAEGSAAAEAAFPAAEETQLDGTPVNGTPANGAAAAAGATAAASAAQAASATPATAVHPQVKAQEPVKSQEPIGATVDPASRPEETEQPPAHEAFWFAVAQHRTAVDERTGAPLFGIEPGGWVLALEDRGDEFLVQHTDGRVGVLRDLSNIERG